MKKTLVALAVAAFATSSASALTIYEQDGSKVSFDGSIRLRLDKESTKTDKATTKRGHSNLHNNGSRFGVKLQHNISDDFYALGRLEFRFNGGDKAKSTDQFGDIYAHRAYVGFGSKAAGELTFGRQATIGGDIAQAGFMQAYDKFDTALTDWGKAVARYDYKGVEGLQVSVDYRFAEEREANEVKKGGLKSGYGAGAVYSFKPAEGQNVTVAAGYTRDNFVTGTSKKHHKDAYAAGAAYEFSGLTLAADYTGYFEKKADSTKDRLNGFRVGAKYAVTPEVNVYTNYGRGVGKTKSAEGKTTEKRVYSGFALGSSYKVHKNVFTYVEGGLLRKTTTTAAKTTKATDRNIAVGLNVSW